MKRICVYSGSSPGVKPEYSAAAQNLGMALFERNLELVFGGGSVGLMGVIADTVMKAGGRVIGVIPQFLQDKELGHGNVTELRVVESMHERKKLMYELSDGFIALPGGLGTLEEIFEMLTWGQLGLHPKPCGFLNICRYYDGIIDFLDHANDQRFVKDEHRKMIYIDTEPSGLLNQFQKHRVPEVGKWLDLDKT